MKVQQPDWEEIVMLCQEKIRKKYDEYGNSWLETDTKAERKFWIARLQDELKEVIKELKKQDHKATIGECSDLINVCAMIATLEMKKLG